MQLLNKLNIHLTVSNFPALGLKSITHQDMDTVRLWKNKHKQFFFHQEDISVEQQELWYQSFVKRPYDLMFMTTYEQNVFGCMGIRWQEQHWDIYNVILGNQAFGKQGLMGKCLNTLLSYAQSLKQGKFTLQVLRHNPAVSWYQKQGFRITEEYETYFFMLCDDVLSSKFEDK
jgi:ribosomal protein S18 acetylase RimI-like enzyme